MQAFLLKVIAILLFIITTTWEKDKYASDQLAKIPISKLSL